MTGCDIDTGSSATALQPSNDAPRGGRTGPDSPAPQLGVGQRRHTWWMLTLVSVAVLSGCSVPVEVDKPHSDFRGSVDGSFTNWVYGDQARVYLPSGRWSLMGEETMTVTVGLLDVGLRMNRGALGRFQSTELSKNELSGLVYVRELTLDTSPAMRAVIDFREVYPGLCVVDDETNAVLYTYDVFANNETMVGCWGLGFVDLSPDNPENYFEMMDRELTSALNRDMQAEGEFTLREQMADFIRREGVSVPVNLLSVTFAGASRGRVLQVDYFFNPDLEGIPQSRSGRFEDSDWNRANIGRYPKKIAYVNSLVDWARDVELRFVNGLLFGPQAGSAASGSK